MLVSHSNTMNQLDATGYHPDLTQILMWGNSDGTRFQLGVSCVSHSPVVHGGMCPPATACSVCNYRYMFNYALVRIMGCQGFQSSSLLAPDPLGGSHVPIRIPATFINPPSCVRTSRVSSLLCEVDICGSKRLCGAGHQAWAVAEATRCGKREALPQLFASATFANAVSAVAAGVIGHSLVAANAELNSRPPATPGGVGGASLRFAQT